MRNIFLSVVGILMIAACGSKTPSVAQDYPLKSERPKPVSSTLIGVCEDRHEALLAAVFTFKDGQVLVVDGKNMHGFSDAAEIVRYAATAGTTYSFAQSCGDATT
jgi:hypothetical protein